MFAFTYTPASAGVETLTLTNGQAGWSNPPAFSYTERFLLDRDLDPAANDNAPMWLDVAA